MKKKKLSHLAVEFILSRNIEELASLTQDTLVHHLEVSLSQLLPEFQKDQKITLTRFIIREKMHRAALFLETADSPSIDNLAQLLGFASTPDFCQEFQGYLAIEPEKYWALKHNLNTE